jgi:hypothetical protein
LAQPPGARFTQDRFAVGFWVAPQTDENIEARYAEIAGANFTFVIGLCGGKTPAPVGRQLELCEKYGLKALAPANGLPPEKLPEGSALWGYFLADEPGASRFPELRRTVDAIRRARPGKLSYINLFPNYASPSQLGTKTYGEHVSLFLEQLFPRRRARREPVSRVAGRRASCISATGPRAAASFPRAGRS